jgi:hypothetical protein
LLLDDGFKKMRILHLSHTGLPDLRIEKTAQIMKDEGHELIFLGGRPATRQNLAAFKETRYLHLGNDLEVALSPFPRRRWLREIEDIRPDIIHAHNIIVARFLLGTDYRAIYDDHEYWSKQTFKYAERKMPRGLASRPLMYLIPIWERKVLSRYPTLTTTSNAASEHRRYCSWVGVTRNCPMRQQIAFLDLNNERKGIVYTGNDFEREKFLPHRDMTNLRSYLDFDVINGLSHREMMERLVFYRIGITPWLPHPWHPYSDANRNYEYLHAGLQVIVNQSIKKLFHDNPFVHAFQSYAGLKDVIDGIPDSDPQEIADYAKKEYLWDDQKGTIIEAYSRAGV